MNDMASDLLAAFGLLSFCTMIAVWAMILSDLAVTP